MESITAGTVSGCPHKRWRYLCPSGHRLIRAIVFDWETETFFHSGVDGIDDPLKSIQLITLYCLGRFLQTSKRDFWRKRCVALLRPLGSSPQTPQRHVLSSFSPDCFLQWYFTHNSRSRHHAELYLHSFSFLHLLSSFRLWTPELNVSFGFWFSCVK